MSSPATVGRTTRLLPLLAALLLFAGADTVFPQAGRSPVELEREMNRLFDRAESLFEAGEYTDAENIAALAEQRAQTLEQLLLAEAEDTERAHLLLERARREFERGAFGDVLETTATAQSLLELVAQTRAERTEPHVTSTPTPAPAPGRPADQHEPRTPPPFVSVDEVLVQRPASIIQANLTDAPGSIVEKPDGTVRLYGRARNPWSGDTVYFYREFSSPTSVRNEEGRLFAAIDVIQRVEFEPFDMRAVEIRVARDSHRFGFADDVVLRTEDGRRRRETVRVRIDERLQHEIRAALEQDRVTIVVEGSFQAQRLDVGDSERRGARRVFSATSDSVARATP